MSDYLYCVGKGAGNGCEERQQTQELYRRNAECMANRYVPDDARSYKSWPLTSERLRFSWVHLILTTLSLSLIFALILGANYWGLVPNGYHVALYGIGVVVFVLTGTHYFFFHS